MNKLIFIVLLVTSILYSNEIISERFKYNKKSSLIYDKEYNLIWQDEDNSNTYTIKEAEEYCNKLTISTYSKWRLPTIKELQSIVNYNKSKPAIYSSFKNTLFFDLPVDFEDANYDKYGTNGVYWSSSKLFKYRNNNGYYYINFNFGIVCGTNGNKKNYVRCVHNK